MGGIPETHKSGNTTTPPHFQGETETNMQLSWLGLFLFFKSNAV